jgi:hypothetical protein
VISHCRQAEPHAASLGGPTLAAAGSFTLGWPLSEMREPNRQAVALERRRSRMGIMLYTAMIRYPITASSGRKIPSKIMMRYPARPGVSLLVIIFTVLSDMKI